MVSAAVRVGVVGASGYLGAELLRLLSGHPSMEIAEVQGASSAGTTIAEQYPALTAGPGCLEVGPIDLARLVGLDAVFVALPPGRSTDVVAGTVGDVPLVVDLGGDYRLKEAANYPKYYGFEHQRPELLARAVYGLPELFRDDIAKADLVSAPGCYVTAATLGLAPFVREGLVAASGIVVDAASGTSGAGKAPTPALHHSRVNESISAYGVPSHRHTPEMEQVLGAEIVFTPHLAPMTRGIFATCYARAEPGAALAGGGALELLKAAYSSEPFVNVNGSMVSTADAYGSNTAHMTAVFDERTSFLVVLVAIDNLLKGGAGQALQAANIALGLDETAGLPVLGLVP